MIDHLFTPSTALLFNAKKEVVTDRKRKIKKVRGSKSMEKNIRFHDNNEREK